MFSLCTPTLQAADDGGVDGAVRYRRSSKGGDTNGTIYPAVIGVQKAPAAKSGIVTYPAISGSTSVASCVNDSCQPR
jgi:hypothetical protein